MIPMREITIKIKDESLKQFFERENKEKGMKLSQAVGMG